MSNDVQNRDEAWWQRVLDIVFAYCETRHRVDVEGGLRCLESLKALVSPPPALDVDALAKRAQYLHDCNSSVTVKECVVAAAREMGVHKQAPALDVEEIVRAVQELQLNGETPSRALRAVLRDRTGTSGKRTCRTCGRAARKATRDLAVEQERGGR